MEWILDLCSRRFNDYSNIWFQFVIPDPNYLECDDHGIRSHQQTGYRKTRVYPP
ncbi:hypothetical protein GECvBGOT_gp029 [Salmonella phage GEC_vB_GOT]|nr:hypothetical protein GECvBGOT_gp029 [Salmonella phage GEC_vB_GOT]